MTRRRAGTNRQWNRGSMGNISTDIPGNMYMPITGVHHCHLLSRPLLARETMTLGSSVRVPHSILDKEADSLHEHLSPNNAGVDWGKGKDVSLVYRGRGLQGRRLTEAKEEPAKLRAARFSYPERRDSEHYTNGDT